MSKIRLLVFPLVILFCTVAVSEARADPGDGSGIDCSEVVANSYPPSDGGGGGDTIGNQSQITWGDANGDGRTGDMIVSTRGRDDDGNRITTTEVILADWQWSCQLAGSCTDTVADAGGSGNGGNGGSGNGGNGGDGNGGNGNGDNGNGGNGNGGNGGNDDDSGGGNNGGSGNGVGNGPWRRRCNTGPWINGVILNGSGDGSDGSGAGPSFTGGATSGCSGPDDIPPGCLRIAVGATGIQCIPNCTEQTADGSPACLSVLRAPYPRGLVSVPNFFTIDGPYSIDGATDSCPNPGGEFPLHINRSLRVRFEMDKTKLPLWTFDERVWNMAKGIPNTAAGFVVEHTYETSSFPTFPGDKPFVGPGFDQLLPAYLVRVGSWWNASVIREWDQYEWYFEYNEVSCTYNPGRRNHDPACSPNGRKLVVKPGFPIYRFAGHMVVKNTYNLLDWGWSASQLYSEAAWDYRQPPIPPYFCITVPTPVLESQSLLQNSGGK